MNYIEIREFCEDTGYISIQKFLHKCFDVKKESIKVNNSHRRWRLKHKEIIGLSNLIVPISLKFAIRYRELVEIGKILIVKDEYGKFKAYYNPKRIMNLCIKANLEEELIKLHHTIYSLNDLAVAVEQIKYLTNMIESMEEDERIIKHFGGANAIDYCENLVDNCQKVRKKDVKQQKMFENENDL